MLLFAVLTKQAGMRAGWLPEDPGWLRRVEGFTLERGLLLSLGLFIAGLALSVHAVTMWAAGDFGALDPQATMRWVVPAVTAMALGGELFLAAFFLEALRLPIRHKVPA